jgi:choline-sulfatase
MPAQRFADMFRPEDMRLPNSWGKADKSKLPQQIVKSINAFASTSKLRDPEAARKHMAFYYANLAQMDDSLGRIVSALKDLNLENDTIVCYTSDHGEMLGDLGLWQKLQFYEGSCGVPLMFRVPGRQAGVCETPVSLVSLSATLTALAGIEQVAPNDGVSLAPLLDSPHSEGHIGPVFAEYGLTGPQKSMIRSGQWKYTYWVHDLPELYDLKNDPGELHNLAAEPEHAAIANELRAQLISWNRPV